MFYCALNIMKFGEFGCFSVEGQIASCNLHNIFVWLSIAWEVAHRKWGLHKTF